MNDLFQGGGDELPVLDEEKNYFDELVGEGKKYKDQNALAKANIHGTATIDIYKKKMDQMREDHQRLANEYKTAASLRELMDQMKSQQPERTSSDTPPANDEQKPVFDPNQVKSLISESIQEHDLKKRQNDNYTLVEKTLRETYGPNYKDHLKSAVDELGLTPTFVNDLAHNHPKVLFRTLGLDEQGRQRETFQAPPGTGMRFQPKPPEKRTWSYYQKMKKENPALYNSPKINSQMVEDAIKLGDEFEDGDFNR